MQFDFDGFPSWAFFVCLFCFDRVYGLKLNLNSVFGGEWVTLTVGLVVFSWPEQIFAPMDHLSALHLQLSYECAHLPYPDPSTHTPSENGGMNC